MNDERVRGFDQRELGIGRLVTECIKKQPGTFLIATIASSLVLLVAVAAVSLVAEADQLFRQFNASTGIIVVIKAGASSAQRDEIRQALESVSGSEEIQPVSIDDVVKASTANADLELKQLPVLIRARAAPAVPSLSSWLDSARRALAPLPMVESIRVDEPWLKSVDLWGARWKQARTGVSIGIAVFFGALAGAIWFLSSSSLAEQTARAGTYIAAIGLIFATAATAGAVWIVSLSVPAFSPFLNTEWRANLMFIGGFVLVAGLLGARTAVAAR